ncbi:hypothetical protein [Paraburkholderia sp. BCC1885]|uniref:hypothetical protein n=1 Tax=Paraburkholderia sp. BCC1885 TaxID=2562669 RepID=UPI001183048F|nr:hypothetical protein [Paraburkholderia sp. BCC1885]
MKSLDLETQSGMQSGTVICLGKRIKQKTGTRKFRFGDLLCVEGEILKAATREFAFRLLSGGVANGLACPTTGAVVAHSFQIPYATHREINLHDWTTRILTTYDSGKPEHAAAPQVSFAAADAVMRGS